MAFIVRAPIRVYKAKRPPWAATRTFHAIDALHRKMGNAVSVDLTKGIQRFKLRIDKGKVYDAWRSGEWAEVVKAVPWEGMKQDIGPALDKAGSAAIGSGIISLKSLPAPAPHLRWDTANPRIREWIAGRTADNFVNLSRDSALNIQNAVTASLDRALTPRQVAARVKNSIGLLPQHAAAVERYRGGLLSGGMPSGKAEGLADRYADRLLDYRANMIAMTETRAATNFGQLAVVRQASDEGLVDRHTTGKRWIVDGNPCPDCLEMSGSIVPIDSSWVMGDGSVVDFPPMGVHPNCYCGFEIVYDVAEGDFDEAA